VGMSGSCTLGRHVVLAGQVGLTDHTNIGDRAVVTIRAGVLRDIKSGEVHGGSPNVPLGIWKKYVALLPKLPDMAKKIRNLENRLQAIENKKPAE